MASRVAVIHHDLMSKGGGEAVTMAVLEALQDDYDLTLLTLDEPDFEELNRYYNAAVEGPDIEIAGRLGPWLHERFGLTYYILQNALLGRYARRHRGEYDCLVSTINELGLGGGAIQYVHFPFDWTVNCNKREEIFHPTVEEDSVYERLCTSVAGVDRAEIQSDELLANSEWTADVVEDAYGTRPRVLYPPVDAEPFDGRPWAEREPGFVALGRIERSKRLRELIRIVDGVRQQGHDTHLHIVGPTVDETYYREVAAMAATRQYVHLDGELPRDDLVNLVCAHRYGIHGKEYEHFGMAVAELAAAGCITFVPASGGQCEIVGDHDALCFESVEDAIEKVDRVMSQPDAAQRFRVGSEEIRRRFGRTRFKQAIRNVVRRQLGETTSVARPEQTAVAPED